MGRKYTVPFDRIAVTAVQDALELTSPSGKSCLLSEVFISQSSDAGDAQAEMLAIQINHGTSGTTSGSGGAAVTPAPVDPGDSAAGFTAERNNTTQMTGGTITLKVADAFNVQAGWQWRALPGKELAFAGGARMTVSLPVAPADSLTMSGYAVVEEIG